MANNNCTTTTGPHFAEEEENSNDQCRTTTTGVSVPNRTPRSPECNPWQLTMAPDSGFIDGVAAEALAIAGADIEVFKLLGVHEQTRLNDATGKGDAISGGALAGFPADNAFTVFTNEWRSVQVGHDNVIASSFIGYDFGNIKSEDGSRQRYSIETAVHKHIMAFAIKQSSNPNNRVTRARLERSENGMKWYGVHVVDIPDNDCLNTILSRDSVPSRYWRLRPLEFNGGPSDRWIVTALQLFHNFQPTFHDNVQDKVFLENRNRDYDIDPMTVKGSYDLIDVQSELTRFGIEIPSQTLHLTLNFQATVAVLGRPIVVGDIIRLPSETQFNADLEPIEKWMEVTDTTWSTEGYTPGWQPTLILVTLQPAWASEETQDIFGDLAENILEDELGLCDKDGRHPLYQDYSDPSQTVINEAEDAVPERGQESSSVFVQFTDEQLMYGESRGINLFKLGQNPRAFQAEDAMPPGNDPFTEGDELPTTGNDGDWHRLTYNNVDRNLPVRLYRYSGAKNRWIFMETDRRAQSNSAIPILQEYLDCPPDQITSNQEITRRDDDC